jgi:pimeloyl-ACP methyl ester carboxylesterase
MQRRLGQVVVESIAAEHPKFTAPLVLIHGFWCTAPMWGQCMGHLAHRGWTCHAPDLRERDSQAGRIDTLRFADHMGAVRSVIEACDAPPVVVGHDLGGLLALACELPAVRAVVAMAPLVPRVAAVTAHPALRWWPTRLAALRSRPLPPPPRRVGMAYFGGAVPGGVLPDSALLARELASDSFRLPGAGPVPKLALAGGRDPFSPPHAVDRLAYQCGATSCRIEEASHAMPWEPGWEDRMSEIHRWLIQTLGEPLLALRGDEEE